LKSVFTDEYEVFLQRLISARKAADVTQQELAERLKKPQSFVSKYERRERRLDVVEFVLISMAVGFDPCLIIKEIEAFLGAPKKKGVRK
jgi:transcriptional regulator with XRE-family HTH domain